MQRLMEWEHKGYKIQNVEDDTTVRTRTPTAPPTAPPDDWQMATRAAAPQVVIFMCNAIDSGHEGLHKLLNRGFFESKIHITHYTANNQEYKIRFIYGNEQRVTSHTLEGTYSKDQKFTVNRVS